jgi:hypothetical protein
MRRILGLIAASFTRSWAPALCIGLFACAAQAQSLRFMGNGVNDIDRVKIRIDDPASSTDIGPPADVGATDFTVEFWMKATSENTSGAVSCGANQNWIWGNALIDRDRYNQGRKFGVSLGGGRIAYGVTNSSGDARTICSGTDLRDNAWHHIAVQRRRSDGYLWLFVDGQLRAQSDGPDGDISYPDNGVPGFYCGSGGASCANSDPFIVLGAEKHDYNRNSAPPFRGWMDELRFSTTLRYSGAFTPPSTAFTPDGATAALYHFDEGVGNDVIDSTSGNRSAGVRKYGGNPAGPVWTTDTPLRVSAPGQVRLTASSYTVNESAGSMAVTVNRSGGSDGAATVEVWIDSGSAVYGADYSPSYGVLSWAGGQSGDRTLQLSVINDTAVESNETATIVLRNAAGARLGSGASATLTITDNDSSPAPAPPPPPPPSGSVAFQDSFARTDNGALQNNWIEKSAAAFRLGSGRAVKDVTASGYRDNLVYRPSSESVLNTEASIELTASSAAIGYPIVLTRLQSSSASTPGSFYGYLLSITNTSGRALISRQNGGGWDAVLSSFALTQAIQANVTYRLRLRATGANPVQLSAWVERYTGSSWQVIGQSTYADSSSARVATAGVVGFAGDTENSYAFDNFRRTDF